MQMCSCIAVRGDFTMQVRVGLWDVVQHPRLRVRLLIMVCVWFVVSLVRTLPPCILAMQSR